MCGVVVGCDAASYVVCVHGRRLRCSRLPVSSQPLAAAVVSDKGRRIVLGPYGSYELATVSVLLRAYQSIGTQQASWARTHVSERPMLVDPSLRLRLRLSESRDPAAAALVQVQGRDA